MKEVSIHEKASIHDFFFPKGAEIETSTLKTTQLDWGCVYTLHHPHKFSTTTDQLTTQFYYSLKN